MTQIYIIRHAEAYGNVHRRYHGSFDSTLTLNGMQQVNALNHKLYGVMFDAVYSSNMRRTTLTANAAAVHSRVDIIHDVRLREVGGGVWEDVAFGNISRSYGEILAAFARDKTACAPGGESAADVYARVSDFLSDLLEKHQNETVCVVSHGLASNLLLTKILYDDIDKRSSVPRIFNASVSLIQHHDGVFKPVYINSTDHLADCSTIAADCELLFRAADGEDDVQFAVDCWREAWFIVHGPTSGFSEIYAESELRRMMRNRAGSLKIACDGYIKAGVVALDASNLEEDDCGHISLLVLKDAYRKRGIGAQLLGEAEHFYRALERNFLRLRVDKGNIHAINFYKRYGFDVCDSRDDDFIMKKCILA